MEGGGMTKEDHLIHLECLKEQADTKGVGLAILKAEGAFYFGDYVTPKEYYEKYLDECKERGWVE